MSKFPAYYYATGVVRIGKIASQTYTHTLTYYIKVHNATEYIKAARAYYVQYILICVDMRVIENNEQDDLDNRITMTFRVSVRNTGSAFVNQNVDEKWVVMQKHALK